MTAEHPAAREEPAALLAAETPRARTERHIVRGLWALAAVALTGALVLWPFFG